jgi:hypothetical protein
MVFKVGGTVIAVAPTGEGLVVSADSLMMVPNVPGYTEDVEKIQTINNRIDLTVSVAGTTKFMPPRPGRVDIQQWMQSAPTKYDVKKAIRACLINDPPDTVNLEYTRRVVDYFRTDITDANNRDPLFEPEEPDQRLFTAVITQYKPETKCSIIAHFSVRRGIDGDIYIELPQCSVYLPGDRFALPTFGDTQFMKGANAPSLFPDFFTCIDRLKAKTVGDVTAAEGMQVTHDAIVMTAKMKTRLYPDSHPTIGGEIQCRLVDGVREPAITVLGRIRRE